MPETILDVRNLRTSFYNEGTELRAVDDLSYKVREGECVAIIGESGSGKTVSALSALRLIPFPPGLITGGEIFFQGENLLELPDNALREIRGSKISMIFQEPGTALNPVKTVGSQIAESLTTHRGMSRRDAYDRAAELLEKVDIPNARERLKQYPHQFSGGMQQRVMIAMAMSCEPRLLIADEPTTALDVTVQAQVLEQLEKLRRETNAALIIITHNLGVVARYADSVKIMYGGRIVEEGYPDDIFENPHHPYSLGLVRAVPRLDLPKSHGLYAIEGEPPNMAELPRDCCAFAKRCEYRKDICERERPDLEVIGAGHRCACFFKENTAAERAALPKAGRTAETRPPRAEFPPDASGVEALSGESLSESGNAELPTGESVKHVFDRRIAMQEPVSPGAGGAIMEVDALAMYFPVTRGLLNRRVAWVKAVDGVSFSIGRGRTLGIVGESGSGKSTVGHCVIGDYEITSGTVHYNGVDLAALTGEQLRKLRREVQMVTQDPFSSLDPRMTIREAVLEGAVVHGLIKNKSEGVRRTADMMELVGLNPEYANRFPHEFSGGQRQRISIARALALNPSFIVCDEVVSALDVSIQAQIIGLLMRLQEELGLTYIFIGHDLSVIRHISDDVAVMYLGKIVEMTKSDHLYDEPLHPYTQALISAVPIPNPTVDRQRERIILTGETPSPINPPRGCGFSARCRRVMRQCEEYAPDLADVGNGHLVACHRVSKGGQTRPNG